MTKKQTGPGRWVEANKKYPQCRAVFRDRQCTLDEGDHVIHLTVYGDATEDWKIQKWVG